MIIVLLSCWWVHILNHPEKSKKKKKDEVVDVDLLKIGHSSLLLGGCQAT